MNDQNQRQSSTDIVVVDDMPANLDVLTEILENAGYQVRGFPDGDFALQSITTALPDLILLDVKMPKMNGYAMCARLKADERTRHIPVIFISALDDIQSKVQGFAAGGMDYITKPFQPEEVLARVQTHLMLQDLRQQLMQHNLQLTQEVARRTQAEAELHKFFSIIAHDLRSPFSTLIGLTGVLVEEFGYYDATKLKAQIGQLHNTSKQVYGLLTNLLAWSSLQRGMMQTDPEHVPLNDLVKKNIRLMTLQAEQKQITLSVSGSEGTSVYADSNMIDTVIRNLITNAVKFTHPGGHIELMILRQDEESVRLTVSDNGIGMTSKCLANLFRIDAKSSQPGTAGEKGTGLGLILCKDLVGKNSGTLVVESQPGAGTRVIVTLPSGAHI